MFLWPNHCSPLGRMKVTSLSSGLFNKCRKALAKEFKSFPPKGAEAWGKVVSVSPLARLWSSCSMWLGEPSTENAELISSRFSITKNLKRELSCGKRMINNCKPFAFATMNVVLCHLDNWEILHLLRKYKRVELGTKHGLHKMGSIRDQALVAFRMEWLVGVYVHLLQTKQLNQGFGRDFDMKVVSIAAGNWFLLVYGFDSSTR